MTEAVRSESPGRLAWLRLRANWLAMGALALVLLVSLATVFAPLVAPQDPELGHPWIGAQPPGSEHPECWPLNVLAVGSPAEIPTGLRGASELVFTVDRRQVDEYRLVLARDGSLRSIQRTEGTEPRQSLAISDADRARTKEGGRTIPAGEARLGEAPPPGWFLPEDRVLILAVDTQGPEQRWTVGLTEGRVSALALDGTPSERAELRGEDVRAVHADGRERRVVHWLGTDTSGRDLFARVLHGGRISLLVGLVATVVSLVIGVLYGAVSGYLGGRSDRVMMAGVDVLYALPFMFLVILLMTVFGRSLLLLFAALGAVQWLTTARIVRGQVLSLMSREFIAAARMSGASPWRILRRHLIPNCLGPVVVYATLTVPAVILQESFLAYLGLGASFAGRQIESWGGLVKNGADAMGVYPWLLLVPGILMALTLLALNALGDGLRDALDPRLEGR